MEFSRALRSKLLLIALLLGVGMAVTHFFLCDIPRSKLNDQFISRQDLLPTSSFAYWIGNSESSWITALYFILVPILAILPFGDSFFVDLKSGYIKNIVVRTKKSNYILAKFITVFTVGGLVVVLPLLLNFLLTAAVLPSLMPQVTAHQYGATMWDSLLFSHPHAYLLAYMLLDFIWGGVCCSIALAISFFVENRFFVLLAPFILLMFWRSISSLLNIPAYSPTSFLVPAQPVEGIAFTKVALVTLLTIAVTLSIYFRKGIHDDVY